VLAGRNAAANEAIAGLLKDELADVSPENRATIAAIGRDLVGVARKNLLGVRPGETLFQDRSLQARKELTAMGLTYHDSKQFLEAVKRNDTIAAELFIAALDGNDRADIVGERTLGRAGIQKLVQLPENRGLWLTYAKYLTPKGDPIHGKGIEPDVRVEEPDVEFGAAAPDKDVMLDTALEHLRKKVA